ncbi:AAA family ATPase [Chamaesiphon sp. VAR_48_metabat_135_sub]|uniref:AAA family ATPase n=1 Tax=Chamaesiphon sp. VAR_48_metabat_135_sub TaxID=2964699 RepID=UPI00286AE12C|nr:AAA family ATPase [Chamaesiphon sp. VAR_48_metabat_135_sub]
MQAIIFIGIQACGKSTFYHHEFGLTHVRINLDMLKTRHREQRMFETCLEIHQQFVIDNTNPTKLDRQRYIEPARQHKFKVVGYYFESRVRDAIERDRQRPLAQQIPEKGIFGTAKRLELPNYTEGFDELYYVKLLPEMQFLVEKWQDKI